MAPRLLSMGWEQSSTGHVIRELNKARYVFNRHPLYRRWTREAFSSRQAMLAQEAPEVVMEYLPTALLILPFIPLIGVLLFGGSAFGVITTVLIYGFILMGFAVAAGSGLLAAGLTAASLNYEHQQGRWELLMLIPYDRVAVLAMRVASSLMPYQPVIGLLDGLQTFMGVVITIGLNGQSATMADDLMALCLVYLVPALFLVTWERRQDYALSVAIGLFGVMRRESTDVWTFALTSPGFNLILRAVFALVAMALSPTPHGIWLVLPVMLGGPSMLLLLGISLPVSLGLLAAYYGLREVCIRLLWRASMQDIAEATH